MIQWIALIVLWVAAHKWYTYLKTNKRTIRKKYKTYSNIVTDLDIVNKWVSAIKKVDIKINLSKLEDIVSWTIGKYIKKDIKKTTTKVTPVKKVEKKVVTKKKTTTKTNRVPRRKKNDK